MVVPYHPACLLCWGAHMNIQAVTNTVWSFYVLKVGWLHSGLHSGHSSSQHQMGSVCAGIAACSVIFSVIGTTGHA
jgi:hypothetical protein